MNKKLIDELLELNIYSSKLMSEEEYSQRDENDKSNRFIYLPRHVNYADGTCVNLFRQIDTKDLTNDEVKLLIDIYTLKNIRVIKKMVCFFVILIVISIMLSACGGMLMAGW